MKHTYTLTVIAATFHSALTRGIKRWDVFLPSLTPVRSFTVKGISPRARFIPVNILPSFPGASSTSQPVRATFAAVDLDIHAEPLPVRNTRSIGQPQLRSTKSTPVHSRAMTSAVGTSSEGLLPASCTPNMVSEGCLLTKDHSSFEPPRNECARPTIQRVGKARKFVEMVTHFLRR